MLAQGKTDGVVGGGIAGVQRGDDVDALGQFRRADRFLDAEIEKPHAFELQSTSQFDGFVDEFGAGFDAEDAPFTDGREVKVVKDET